MDTYPKLEKAPVVVAILQLKISGTDFSVESYLQFESEIRRILPHRHNNINVNTNLNIDTPTLPLGVSKTSATTEAKYESFVFMTNDSKRKLELSNKSITYIVENDYLGWDDFFEKSSFLFQLVSNIWHDRQIERTSIRFVNKFLFNDFEHPEEYFKTLISQTSTEALPFKVAQYAFRLMIDVTKDTYGIINQSVDKVGENYNYYFDIDVINKEQYYFSIDKLSQVSNQLRRYKNELFFNNITSKTLSLCK